MYVDRSDEVCYNGGMSSYTIDSFSVKNYRSIYDEQTVYFDAGRSVTAFYGANASGKTSFYRAMADFSKFVRHSTNPDSPDFPRAPFLLRSGAMKEPTVFSIVFHNDENRYKYSFSLLDGKVSEEEMYDLSSSRARTIFVRSRGATELAGKNGFGKKMFEGNEAVRDDSLLITLARHTKNRYADAVFDLLHNIVLFSLDNTDGLRKVCLDILQQYPELSKQVIELLHEADFSINDFSLSTINFTPEMLAGANMPEDMKQMMIRQGKSVFVNTVHTVRNSDGDKVGTVVFDMGSQESLGTNRFFDIAIFVMNAIANGHTIYIDEFGSSLHTSICQFIVQLFKKKGNKTGAKLLINTHDVGLIKNGPIGVLDKDDIMIVEKDRFEQTIITPLKDKMLRSDENIGKKYTMGMYGGVPILEEIS